VPEAEEARRVLITGCLSEMLRNGAMWTTEKMKTSEEDDEGE
jgi:hypothetical protein